MYANIPTLFYLKTQILTLRYKKKGGTPASLNSLKT